MLLGLTYQLVRFITDLVLVRTRSDAQLRAEVLALRHQFRVLERKVGKPAWQPADRIWLAGLSRLLPRSGLQSLLPKPETLLRWHRNLVCRKWAAFRQRPRRQRPVRDPERRALTLQLARENPRWAYCRIQGEMLKLGFGISHMQVARILRSQGITLRARRGAGERSRTGGTRPHRRLHTPHDPVPLHPVAAEIVAQWPAGTFIENLAPAGDGSGWLVTIPSHQRADRVTLNGRREVLAVRCLKRDLSNVNYRRVPADDEPMDPTRSRRSRDRLCGFHRPRLRSSGPADSRHDCQPG